MLDENLAALVGHGAFHGIELHRLVARRRRIVEIVAHRAEGTRHHDPTGFGFARGLQHVAGADHVTFVDFPAMGVVAVDRRNLGRDVIDPLAAFERAPGSVEISDIRPHAFDVEAFQRLVVVLLAQQDPYADAFFEQPPREICAHVPGGAGNEYRRRLRTVPSQHSPCSSRKCRYCPDCYRRGKKTM